MQHPILPLEMQEAIVSERHADIRPARLTDRFHDCICRYFNGLKPSGTDEEKFQYDVFHGLLDSLDAEGLGDPLRPKRKK